MKHVIAILLLIPILLAPAGASNELPDALPVEGWSLLLNEALKRSGGDNNKLAPALLDVAKETGEAALKVPNVPNYKRMGGMISSCLLIWYGLELQRASSAAYDKHQWRQQRVQCVQLIETSRLKAGKQAVDESWHNLLRAARILDLPQVDFVD